MKPHCVRDVNYSLQIEHFAEWNDTMNMICEGWCIINCQRIYEANMTSADTPFSLLSALENGCFFDLTIVADNKKEVILNFFFFETIQNPKFV